MTSTALRTLVVSAAIALGACGTMDGGNSASTPAVASVTPPHAGCTQQTATIYFSDQVQSDEPVAGPLLNTLLDQIHACEHAGGQLLGITISTSADPGQTADGAATQIQRRQGRVRDALVRLGAPAGKISFVPAASPSTDAIMSKRADITANLQ